MKCTEVQHHLAEFLTGDLADQQRQAVEQHVAGCATCRDEYHGLQQVLTALDDVPVAPTHVDFSRLYRQAADRQNRQAKRWRRGTVAGVAVAAVLLLVVCLRVQIRFEAQSVRVSWGDVRDEPPEKQTPRPVLLTPNNRKAELDAEIHLVKELIHALAAEIERVDGRQDERLTRLREKIDHLERLSQQRWTTAERQFTVLYTAQFGSYSEGDSP